MRERRVVRYSTCFKQGVIAELERGRFGSLQQAKEHYGIGGEGTIKGWLRRYGRNDLQAKVVRVEKPDEVEQVQALRKRIRELERALGQTQAARILEEEFLKRACAQLGQEVEAFKKKSDGWSCMPPRNGGS